MSRVPIASLREVATFATWQAGASRCLGARLVLMLVVLVWLTLVLVRIWSICSTCCLLCLGACLELGLAVVVHVCMGASGAFGGGGGVWFSLSLVSSWSPCWWW